MSEFRGVTVVKKANVYFDGKVTSRTVLFADGSKKTLGIMLPGEYEFGTAEKEVMEILSGEMEVLLPGSEGWRAVRGGESFRPFLSGASMISPSGLPSMPIPRITRRAIITRSR